MLPTAAGKPDHERLVLASGVLRRSVERSVAFCIDKFGSASSDGYAEAGCLLVAQVRRKGCVLLLNCQQPDKCGHGRVFVSLDLAPLLALRAEFERSGVPSLRRRIGHDTMFVEAPDGDGLLFQHPRREDAAAGPAD
jgi:hypothetical protein